MTRVLSIISEVVFGLFLKALYLSIGIPEQYSENTVNMNYIDVMRSVFKNTAKQKELEILSHVL